MNIKTGLLFQIRYALHANALLLSSIQITGFQKMLKLSDLKPFPKKKDSRVHTVGFKSTESILKQIKADSKVKERSISDIVFRIVKDYYSETGNEK